MFCQAFRFLAGKMNDCPMFGRSKVSSPHHSLVKLSQRSEMYEVGSFTESEIMNLLPVHIIHQHPSILTNAFPQIRVLRNKLTPLQIVITNGYTCSIFQVAKITKKGVWLYSLFVKTIFRLIIDEVCIISTRYSVSFS